MVIDHLLSGLNHPFDGVKKKKNEHSKNLCHPFPIGSMYAIYGNMDPINIAYIPAPWIHGSYGFILLDWDQDSQLMDCESSPIS